MRNQTRILTPEELESLRLDMEHASTWMRAELARRRALSGVQPTASQPAQAVQEWADPSDDSAH